ncbi:MAG: MarR family transcriptional regulator [Pseudomonadota bacterium]
MTSPSDDEIDRLARVIRSLIRELLIAGRVGAPAEGKIPFNPLYFHMLGHLLNHRRARPSELAAFLGVARTTLSTASKALQSRGLIKQAPDPEDGRAQMLVLTTEGRKVAQAIRRQDRKNMKLLLERIDPAARSILIETIEQVVLTEDND